MITVIIFILFQDDYKKVQKELANRSKFLNADEPKSEEYEDEFKEELEYLTNDSLRKYHFTYNESL